MTSVTRVDADGGDGPARGARDRDPGRCAVVRVVESEARRRVESERWRGGCADVGHETSRVSPRAFPRGAGVGRAKRQRNLESQRRCVIPDQVQRLSVRRSDQERVGVAVVVHPLVQQGPGGASVRAAIEPLHGRGVADAEQHAGHGPVVDELDVLADDPATGSPVTPGSGAIGRGRGTQAEDPAPSIGRRFEYEPEGVGSGKPGRRSHRSERRTGVRRFEYAVGSRQQQAIGVQDIGLQPLHLAVARYAPGNGPLPSVVVAPVDHRFSIVEADAQCIDARLRRRCEGELPDEVVGRVVGKDELEGLAAVG